MTTEDPYAGYTALQRELFGLPPLGDDAAPPVDTGSDATPDAALDSDGINPEDSPPTSTPTDAQVSEAAELLRLADVELQADAPDRHVVGILRRLGLPDTDALVATVKAAARDGAPATLPADLNGTAAPASDSINTDDAGGDASSGNDKGVPPPAVDTPNQKAAKHIAEHMRVEQVGSLPVKKARMLARTGGGIARLSGKRWQAIVLVAESLGLFVQLGTDGNVAPVQLPPLHVSRLQQLGFDIAQVARMLPAERRRCIDDGLTDSGRSVLPDGTVQDVPGAGEHDDGSEGTIDTGPGTQMPPSHVDAVKPTLAAEPAPTPTEAAPTPTEAEQVDAHRPALPHRCIIFVGALPVGVGVGVDITFAAFIAPLEAHVGATHDAEGKPVSDEARAVGSYQIISYAQGPKLVAAQLAAMMHKNAAALRGTMFVDPMHPCVNDCLPVLQRLPGVLIVRAVR